MGDLQTVCCMCGDVGFADKLFRCNKCLHRFQHSYCSNYYGEFSELNEMCDWCRSEERNNARHGSSSTKKSVAAGGQDIGVTSRSEYSGEKIKQHDHHHHHHNHHHHHHHRDDSSSSSAASAAAAAAAEKGNKNPSGGVPSPRPTTRRYKLLKDVMC